MYQGGTAQVSVARPPEGQLDRQVARRLLEAGAADGWLRLHPRPSRALRVRHDVHSRLQARERLGGREEVRHQRGAGLFAGAAMQQDRQPGGLPPVGLEGRAVLLVAREALGREVRANQRQHRGEIFNLARRQPLEVHPAEDGGVGGPPGLPPQVRPCRARPRLPTEGRGLRQLHGRPKRLPVLHHLQGRPRRPQRGRRRAAEDDVHWGRLESRVGQQL
mmetsp:Transcript_32911/g.92518  ORF Transcript_32911/g.92518 Transcript_32911/m.92518 type:complete len:219 (+) Transcript_32911:274-930(+)